MITNHSDDDSANCIISVKTFFIREENWNWRKLYHMTSNRQETRPGALPRFRDTVLFSSRCSQQQRRQGTFCPYSSSWQLGQADDVPPVTFWSHLLPSTVLDAATATASGHLLKKPDHWFPQETRTFLFKFCLIHYILGNEVGFVVVFNFMWNCTFLL